VGIGEVPRFRRALQVHGPVGPGRVFGTLALSRMTDDEWTPADVEFLTQVASQIAIAVENSLTYRELGQITERLAIEKVYLEDEIRLDQNIGNMVGGGPAFQAVRELQNVLERSVILSSGNVLQVAMPELIGKAGSITLHERSPAESPNAERATILKALEEARGQVRGPEGAAARLGLKRTTLQSRMRKYNIARQFG